MEKRKFKGYGGLRAFAISMVVACHVGLLSPSSGGIGNKIFFCLSGFLAYFSLKNISSIKNVFCYYWNKIRRIVPTYYLIILFAAIAFPAFIMINDFSSENSLLLNMLFLKNFGHLWFLQQIMLMYLVAPLFILLCNMIESVTSKIFLQTKSDEMKSFIAKLICTVVLLLIACLEKRYLTTDILKLSGEGSHAQFGLWMFLIGFAFALLYDGCSRVNKIVSFFSLRYVKAASSIYLILFLSVLFLFVIPSVHDSYPAISRFLEKDFIRIFSPGIAIFLLAVTPDTVVKKLLDNRIFLLISDCSFEIYMIHFFLLSCFGGLSAKRNFIAVYIVSLCIGYCSKKLIDVVRQRKVKV